MKFGNYNISQSPKEKSRKFDLFRFSKLKSTTNSFVGRFHTKIETFRRLKSRSESPLSFRASLFERDGLFSRAVCEKFSPKDFPKNHFTRDNFYVFGNTIRKWSVNQRTISGKNNYLSEHYYCTLRADGGGERSGANKGTLKASNNERSGTNSLNRLANKSATLRPNPSGPLADIDNLVTTKPYKRWSDSDCGEKESSVIYVSRSTLNRSTLNRSTLNRRYTNSLKDILDSMSHLDEDTEFKVLKEYFETNSYSDIVRDSHFKDYLNKKNYRDILDYMNDESVATDTSTLRIRMRTPYEDLTRYDSNATDTSKLYKSKSTGNLYESLSIYNRGLPDTCETQTSTLKRQREPPMYISTPTLTRRPSISRHQGRYDLRAGNGVQNTSIYGTMQSTLPSKGTKSRKARAPPPPKQQDQAQNHEEVKRICESFLNDNLLFNKKNGGYDTSTLAKQYSERQYKKLIAKFVKGKGYTTTDDYIQAKFGPVLERSIPNYTQSTQKLDLPKTYIDSVQRRYQVTKQHFLAAEQLRNQQQQQQQPRVAHIAPCFQGNYRSTSSSTHELYNRGQSGQTTGPFAEPAPASYERTPHRYYRTLGGCAGNCGGRLRDSVSLPSTLNSTYDDLCYGRRYFDSDTANCDIFCDSCMAEYLRQPVQYRKAYYNVYNDHYSCGNYQRRKNYPHPQQNHSSATLCANYVK